MSVFAGKAVILTGASQGIGKALCLALAPQKPRLALAARDIDALEAVASSAREAGAQTLVVPTDVSSQDECRRLVARTVDAFGGLDALVNNAGMSMWARLDELKDLSAYETLMRVNYLSCVYLTHAALPHSRNREAGS